MTNRPISAITPSRQVAFHQLLVGARKKWLVDALSDALKEVDPIRLKTELSEYVPVDIQTVLSAAGIRDEYIFPTPVVLEVQPTLVGYYRLLLGVSQKRFYRSDTGMGRFKSMEVSGGLTQTQKDQLPPFCRAMSQSLSELIRQLSPTVTPRDVNELPLLTLGAQFQGGNNVSIGKQATEDVFLSIIDVVRNHIVSQTARQVTVVNASGRSVMITLSSDPDVCIEEHFGENISKKVAIEIKGGTDMSNAHNRAGEAEKSHQKAKNDGYRECWTIIMKKGLEQVKLESESPTTNAWFDTAQILGREGPEWHQFKDRIIGAVGIPGDSS